MDNVIRVFGQFNIEQVIVFGSALYGLYKVLEKVYKAATGFHDKQQESEYITCKGGLRWKEYLIAPRQ